MWDGWVGVSSAAGTGSEPWASLIFQRLGHEITVIANGNLCGLVFINSINVHLTILVNVYEHWLLASVSERGKMGFWRSLLPHIHIKFVLHNSKLSNRWSWNGSQHLVRACLGKGRSAGIVHTSPLLLSSPAMPPVLSEGSLCYLAHWVLSFLGDFRCTGPSLSCLRAGVCGKPEVWGSGVNRPSSVLVVFCHLHLPGSDAGA